VQAADDSFEFRDSGRFARCYAVSGEGVLGVFVVFFFPFGGERRRDFVFSGRLRDVFAAFDFVDNGDFEFFCELSALLLQRIPPCVRTPLWLNYVSTARGTIQTINIPTIIANIKVTTVVLGFKYKCLSGKVNYFT